MLSKLDYSHLLSAYRSIWNNRRLAAENGNEEFIKKLNFKTQVHSFLTKY